MKTWTRKYIGNTNGIVKAVVDEIDIDVSRCFVYYEFYYNTNTCAPQ